MNKKQGRNPPNRTSTPADLSPQTPASHYNLQILRYSAHLRAELNGMCKLLEACEPGEAMPKELEAIIDNYLRVIGELVDSLYRLENKTCSNSNK
jgi:hypothetical protein